MNFIGTLSSSKSLFNRALILKSFNPALKIVGHSQADDVTKMTIAVDDLLAGKTWFDCGDAGTVLRFLALRVSRETGKFELTGSTRLFERPQQELTRIFNQLGVKSSFEKTSLFIESEGWKPQGDTLLVPCGKSSQFLSAVALSAWSLPFDLYISPENFSFSRAYFWMTRKMLEESGMGFKDWDHDFCILKNHPLQRTEIIIEPDMSSCFALAAVAAVSGHLVLNQFPLESSQPDIYFLSVLKAMGVPFEASEGRLKVSKADRLQGVRVSLRDCPDLFPVLASLCSLAKGPSELRGAPHLRFKESSRIEKTKELLEKVGCHVEVFDDGISILPPENLKSHFVFDPDGDHRLAMAAAVLQKAGVEFELKDPQVVNKSFPEFWMAVGMRN